MIFGAVHTILQRNLISIAVDIHSNLPLITHSYLIITRQDLLWS